ncbi:MAG: hypothetical protein WBO34_05240, partial [Gammaproteobacteria bacterium]
MKIALIQDEIYLPSFGGGTKANRYLLEEFARNGHECVAYTRALTRSADGPNDIAQFYAEVSAHGANAQEAEPGVFSYKHEGVQVEALNFADFNEQRDCLVRRIQAMGP